MLANKLPRNKMNQLFESLVCGRRLRLPTLTSFNLADRETAPLSTKRPGMSDTFIRPGADGGMMKVCRNSEGLMCIYPFRAASNFETDAVELHVRCKHTVPKKADYHILFSKTGNAR